MKLRTKLILGFAAVILVMVVFGAVASVMFKRVDSNVASVNRDSLPAVRYATGFERSALEAILDEKNFLLSRNGDIPAQVKSKLEQLAAHLSDIDTLAKSSNNKELASRSAEVRKVTEEYGRLFNGAVEAMERNKTEERLMDERGAAVDVEALAFMKAKKAEFLEVHNAISIVNNINVWALDMRLNEKSYLLNQDQQALNAIDRDMTSLLSAYDALEKLHPDATEKKQIENARNATLEYKKALESWVAEYKRDAQSGALADHSKTMNRSGDTASQMVDDYTLVKQGAFEKIAESVFIVTEISQKALDARVKEKTFLNSRDPKHWESLNSNLQELPKLYGALRKVSLTSEDRNRVDRATKATEGYVAAANAWVRNDEEMRQTILPKMKQNGEMVIASAQTIQNDAWKTSDEMSHRTRSIVSTSNLIIIFALAFGVFMGTILAWLIPRSITRPINRIIGGLDSASNHVSKAATQVSSASQQLAEGTSEQAASIEETSSSLEEMSSMTKQNAENSAQANHLMEDAGKIIRRANESMDRLTVSMRDISQASVETQKIVKTIDEIAFQTNLLALNAAVEAARAGEAGAGFAVVADEVRNLAMRAADAARNTAELIEGTAKKVKDGSSLVAETNESFRQVAGSASRATELVGEISAASSEQAQGIGQINTAVLELDKVTQQNAANAEESASAAQEMSAQAVHLSAMVNELVVLVSGASAKRKDISTSRLSSSEKAEKKTNAPKPAIEGKAPTPSEVIPLEEEDFREF